MNTGINLNTYALRTVLVFMFGMTISATSHAVQPMTESDLEVVSATTGSNILNIFGASQAGLKVDDSSDPINSTSNVTLTQEAYNEGEATSPIVLSKLQKLDQEAIQSNSTDNQDASSITLETQDTIIKLNEFTTGSASAFTTSSEINYKTSNVHHEMRDLENGGVGVSRDLQIDLLKLENLRGAHLDESRSAGSIYISDWSSRGDTRILKAE